MCDLNEYNEIFRRIERLSPKDTVQIILESDDKDEQKFYGMVGDYLLQKRQKKVIERKLF